MFVKEKGIYTRKPETIYCCRVIDLLSGHMDNNRTEEMASLEVYVELLWEFRHSLKIFVVNRWVMKIIRQHATQFIFYKYKKDGVVRKDAKFDEPIVNMS